MKPVTFVANRNVPKVARLSPQTLLDRVRNVEQIRTRQSVTVSLFLTNADRMGQLTGLHAAVQTGTFDAHLAGFQLARSWVPFVLELPTPLYQWLSSRSLEEVRAQVLNWLAALYAAHCCRFQLWARVLPEVKRLARARYTPYVPQQAEALTDVWAAEYDRAVAQDGGLPMGILSNPFTDNERPYLDAPQVQAGYRFPVRVGYFSEEDWLFIVERSRPKLIKRFRGNLDCGAWTLRDIDQQMRSAETDKLNRAESIPELWQGWQQVFNDLATAAV